MSHRSAIGGLQHIAGLVAPKFRWKRNKGGLAAAKSRPRRDVDGFTLLEIVVVLALFGLITALLIGGSSALLRSAGREDVEQTALSAIAAARHAAVLSGRTLELRVDEKARALDWSAGRAALAGEDAVRLLPPARISAVLIGGRLQEEPLAGVHFYADGTCDPFRLEIVREKTNQILVIDPWTCTVLAPVAATRTR